MATVVPPNRAVDLALRTNNTARIAQLEGDQRRRDAEDYRTVSTDRGPVRGTR